MELPFTHKPGRRERHLRRRHRNPLFGWPTQKVAPEELLAAEIDALVGILEPRQLTTLVQRAAPILNGLEAQGISINTPVARLRQMTAGLERADPTVEVSN